MGNIKEYNGGSPSALREINMSVVLDRIKGTNAISRVSLSRELNITQTTINRIVNQLIKEGLVIETGFGESSGGKKPRILKYNASRAYVIGIEVDIDHINIILTDLSAKEMAYISNKFEKKIDYRFINKYIFKYIDYVIKDSGINKDKIEVIALGLPAMVHPKDGTISLCPSIPFWEGINLNNTIKKEFGCDVMSDNAPNMAVIGEQKFGVAKSLNNVVFFWVGTGIGAGIIIDGKIYKGSNGAAGEVGYMQINKSVPKNTNEKYGQFEFLASTLAILRRVREEIKAGSKPSFLSKKKLDIERITLNDIIDAYHHNELFIKRIIDETLDNLALGIGNVITTLNPEIVLIRSELLSAENCFFEIFKKKIQNFVPFCPNISITTLGEKAVALGAISMAIQKIDQQILSPLFH